MENQDVKIAPQSETQNAAFCAYCGAQVAADAAVCMSCGCPVKAESSQPVSQPAVTRHGAPAKKSPLMWILLGIGAVILVAGVLVLTLVVAPEMRKAEIRKQLAGETFIFYERSTYSISKDTLEFVDEETCEENSYYIGYSSWENEYTWSYEIELDGDDAYVLVGIKKCRIDFSGGKIESLYDVKYKERFEKQ